MARKNRPKYSPLELPLPERLGQIKLVKTDAPPTPPPPFSSEDHKWPAIGELLSNDQEEEAVDLYGLYDDLIEDPQTMSRKDFNDAVESTLYHSRTESKFLSHFPAYNQVGNDAPALIEAPPALTRNAPPVDGDKNEDNSSSLSGMFPRVLLIGDLLIGVDDPQISGSSGKTLSRLEEKARVEYAPYGHSLTQSKFLGILPLYNQVSNDAPASIEAPPALNRNDPPVEGDKDKDSGPCPRMMLGHRSIEAPPALTRNAPQLEGDKDEDSGITSDELLIGTQPISMTQDPQTSGSSGKTMSRAEEKSRNPSLQ